MEDYLTNKILSRFRCSFIFVHHKLLPSHTSIPGSATAAVSTTGAPLDIAGWATLTVSLGMFTVTHEFTVVHHLTVDCLLGADFFKRYKGIVDCGNSALFDQKEPSIHNSYHARHLQVTGCSTNQYHLGCCQCHCWWPYHLCTIKPL